MDLKYLFEAEFEDGSIFTQPADNRHPDHDESKEHNPSAFRYVEDHLDTLDFFSLVGDGHRVTVNMKNGLFMVDDLVVQAHAQDEYPEQYPLRLIYFRDVRRETDIKATVNADMGIDEEVLDERIGIAGYYLGWQYTDRNGRNVSRTLAVA